MARVAYQLPRAGGRLSVKLMDEQKRVVPTTQPALTLTQAQGETVVTFKVKVPTGIQRLTLMAPVTLPGDAQAAGTASANFRVVLDSPAFHKETEFRRVP
ncbi:hypothetical protein D3C72_1712970 [compost metagenome]